MNLDRIEQQAGHLPAYQIADSVNEALMESLTLLLQLLLVPVNLPSSRSPFYGA